MEGEKFRKEIDFMTNKEIAAKLGLSPAALSLVINHKPGVSEETRERVFAQLKEMGYAHIIKKSPVIQSDNISFIIYKRNGEILDSHPFFLLLMEIIEQKAREYGYNILLSTIDKRKELDSQLTHIKGLDSQGAILFATEMREEDMLPFLELDIPIVSMDNDFPRLSCNSISINNQMGTWQAVDHLVKHNFQQIGYLKSLSRISSFEEREWGFQNALNYHGLSFQKEHILSLPHTEEGSYRDMLAYLNGPHPKLPKAFVSDDDTVALGVMRALSEKGYKIPEDISIIGFNDRPSSEITIPPLTTINVSKYSFATETVDELMRLIKNTEKNITESRSRKIRIGTKLIVRDSTL